MSADLAVRGGLVITPHGAVEGDVLIEGGLVAAVERGAAAARDEIDASGCVVLPGAVDAHVHVGLHYLLVGGGRARSADRIGDASRAAAAGGTTTMVDFAMQEPGEGLLEPLRRRLDDLRASAVDVALHCWMVDDTAEALAEIPALVEAGVPALKVFLAYSQRGAPLDDGALFDVWQALAACGGIAQAHCENAGIIDRRLREARAERARGYAGFAVTRPPVSEVEAVSRTAVFAEASGTETYCVHLSAAGSAEIVRRARAAGVDLHGECCPHHLLLDEAAYLGPRAGDFVMSPPLRTAADRDALWAGLVDGTLEVVASDHSAWPAPLKTPGPGFLEAIHGVAGNGLLLPLMAAQVGVRPGVDWELVARATATAPARIFRLAGKGVIAPGCDADLAIVCPDDRAPVPRVPPYWQTDNGVFAGRDAVPPRLVLQRGERVAERGSFCGRDAAGRFVPGRAGESASRA